MMVNKGERGTTDMERQTTPLYTLVFFLNITSVLNKKPKETLFKQVMGTAVLFKMFVLYGLFVLCLRRS